jgi:hypothetical protein
VETERNDRRKADRKAHAEAVRKEAREATAEARRAWFAATDEEAADLAAEIAAES